MQIQLTQDELKDAVRQYVAKDFNLEGRTLSISFTATRGDAGIVTNLSINKDGDVEIPGYTNSAPDTAVATGNAAVAETKPAAEAAAPAAADTATTTAAVAKTEAPVATAAVAAPAVEEVAQAVEAKAEVAAPAAAVAETAAAATDAPKTTNSLFG